MAQKDARTIQAELARPFADEVTADTLGNLIVHKKGDGPRVMFAAHMDSIGFIVTHIEKEGFSRLRGQREMRFWLNIRMLPKLL